MTRLCQGRNAPRHFTRARLIAGSGERISAELSHERYRALGIDQGSTVYVTPRAIRIFGDDYMLSKQIGVA